MVLVIALVGAALSGAVAWRETQRYKQEHGELFFAIEPKLATGGATFVAAVIGWIASPIVLGFLVGYALYREALLFEDDQFDGALDVPARMWAGVGFVVGFFGALFTSTLLWGGICAFLLLAGAYYFAWKKTRALAAHRDALLAHNSALVAENTKLKEVAKKPQTRTLESFERRRETQAAVAKAAWTAPANDGDLLPRAR